MNPQTILSIKENIVQEARSLQNAKGRILAGKFLVEGENQILWALENRSPLEAVLWLKVITLIRLPCA